ncbi:MAG: bifunctional 4-hydroxy-2-oxoglutarate aldolase/2-dehydro-3-deoxy-phosphogluconate aldolase [Oscillospiraceae bacterium]
MKYSERLGNNALVPVVVIEDAKNAVPTARALLAGGIDVMEITLRTAAAMDAIRAVVAEVPEMLVGAGTVLNLEQAKAVVTAGGKFIVAPGFDPETVKWCMENDITVTPGCVTPTEIMAALKLGVDVIKFFPANVYGGLAAMKGLAGPFVGIKFIPTGGVNGQNIGEYAAAPFVHTVGGSWVCTKKDISEGNFEKITALCREAVEGSLGFELAHVGINTQSGDAAMSVATEFDRAFGFGVKDGNSSTFAGKGVEVMKTMFLGSNGHIAVKTNNIKRALAFLGAKGFEADMETAKYKSDKMIAVYLKNEMGGFAVHLLQK